MVKPSLPFRVNNPLIDPETRFYLARCEALRSGKRTSRSITYISGDELLNAAYEYFQWSDNNPIKEEIVNFSAKELVHVKDYTNKKRPYTFNGLCSYIGLCTSSWYSYKRDKRFKKSCEIIEKIIWDDKYQGAAVGIYNSNLIARDLGLAEKKEVTGVEDGKPIEIISRSMTDEEAAEAYRKTRETL